MGRRKSAALGRGGEVFGLDPDAVGCLGGSWMDVGPWVGKNGERGERTRAGMVAQMTRQR